MATENIPWGASALEKLRTMANLSSPAKRELVQRLFSMAKRILPMKTADSMLLEVAGLVAMNQDQYAPLGYVSACQDLRYQAIIEGLIQAPSCLHCRKIIPTGRTVEGCCNDKCAKLYASTEELRAELEAKAKEDADADAAYEAERLRIVAEAAKPKPPKPAHDCPGCVRCKYDYRAMAWASVPRGAPVEVARPPLEPELAPHDKFCGEKAEVCDCPFIS